MIDVDKWRQSSPQHEEAPKAKSICWRRVPVECLMEFLEERAAVRQFDAGMTRESAERSAVHDGNARFQVYELIFE